MSVSERYQFHREKFADVVQYVCAVCSREELGKVKLHKILYFSDMLNYLETGQPLTGAEYQKQKFGPVAKPLTRAIEDLKAQGRIDETIRDFHGYAKSDFTSLKEPDCSRVSKREIALVNEVIDFVCARSAREISELSHNAAWELAEMGETIPYFTAYGLLPGEVTDEDMEFAVAEARRIAPAIDSETHAR